jgi:nucleoside 2-deoxyribosyltransferase
VNSIYLIGSLRNPEVPRLAERLRRSGFEVFDDWYAAGKKADDAWKAYEQARGRDYITALKGYPARHVFEYDAHHLARCSIAVLMLPAGRSGHLELGIAIGTGKPSYILLDKVNVRWDVMYNFATGVFDDIEQLAAHLRREHT